MVEKQLDGRDVIPGCLEAPRLQPKEQGNALPLCQVLVSLSKIRNRLAGRGKRQPPALTNRRIGLQRFRPSLEMHSQAIALLRAFKRFPAKVSSPPHEGRIWLGAAERSLIREGMHEGDNKLPAWS